MELDPEPGDLVLMLSRGGDRTVHQSRVSTVLAGGVALDLRSEDGQAYPVERRERLVVVLVRGDVRHASEAVVMATAGDQLRVQLLTPWAVVERRLFPRFETSLRVLISPPGANDPLIPGRVLDLSAGGIRLVVPRPVPTEVDVIVHGESGTRLPAEVIRSQRVGKEFDLRTRFLPLSTMQRRFVYDMVSALQALNEHGRNLLAS